MEKSDPVEFLAHILPDEGWRCGVALSGEKRIQKLFATNAELADFLMKHNAKGEDVYHACAVFKTPANRKAENALGAKTFWLDIDVGDDPKKYFSETAAIGALGAFCQAAEMPPPTIVLSGGGLHVYWVLTEMLDPLSWRAHALALKQLCVTHGLRADPTRTADISSILRTPGTHNHKYYN